MIRELEALTTYGYVVNITAKEDDGDYLFTVVVEKNKMVAVASDTTLSEAIKKAYRDVKNKGD